MQIKKAISRMHADESGLNDISRLVIGGAFTGVNVLAVGFIGKVYESALAHELRMAGRAVDRLRGLTIIYDGNVAGECVADPIVERERLVGLRTVTALNEAHHVQCIDYLKASGRRLGLPLNFGAKRLEIERIANTV